MNKIKLSSIKPNPDNPRRIKPHKLKLLVDSISEFSAMMYLRPIVIDENNVILGGNQRYLALKALKYKEIPSEWIKQATDLTEDQKRRFIVADNVNFGTWDYEIIEANYAPYELENWGVEIITTDQDKIIDSEQTRQKAKKRDSDNDIFVCPHCGEEIDL